MKKIVACSKLLGLFAVLTGFLSLAGCSNENEKNTPVPPEVKPLRIGMELTYPPFEMIEADGTPSGVGVEMARALAESLGRPLKIENIAFDGLIIALKSGRVDLVISSMTANDERRRSIGFSDPYVSTGLSLLVGKDSDISGIDDLKTGRNRVVVKLGTTGETYANTHLTNASIGVLEEDIACVLEVAQGKADAFIYDQLSIYNHQKKHQGTTRALLTPFQKEVWAVGIRKGNDALKEKVDSFLAEFRKDGGFDRLAEKYLKDEKIFLEAQGIPFVF